MMISEIFLPEFIFNFYILSNELWNLSFWWDVPGQLEVVWSAQSRRVSFNAAFSAVCLQMPMNMSVFAAVLPCESRWGTLSVVCAFNATLEYQMSMNTNGYVSWARSFAELASLCIFYEQCWGALYVQNHCYFPSHYFSFSDTNYFC